MYLMQYALPQSKDLDILILADSVKPVNQTEACADLNSLSDMKQLPVWAIFFHILFNRSSMIPTNSAICW